MGIGGVSTSLLARYLRASGVEVTGTDRNASDVLLSLQEDGIAAWTGFLPEKTGKPDAAVYSSAIPKTDAEYLYLSSCGVPLFERYELLGAVNNRFSCSVCIAGTHGKTTTTAMISKVLMDAGKKLFSHVGGKCDDIGDFLYTGDDYFICEACEYKKSLLALKADIAVVLNAELDHPDTYSSLSEVYDTFDLYLQNAKKHSLKIVCSDDRYYLDRQFQNNPITFGKGENCGFRITNIREKDGKFGCDIEYANKPLYSFDLSIIGEHNLYNAAACAAVCALLKIDAETVNESLSSFSGVARRFEYKGRMGKTKVYSDYAHHPTEIASCLSSARRITPGGGKLWAVFQPHTFSRTRALCDKFRLALTNCDGLIVVKEYAARENPEDGMSARALFAEINHDNKFYCPTVLDAATILVKKTTPSDLIVILGAGNVETLCDLLVTRA